MPTDINEVQVETNLSVRRSRIACFGSVALGSEAHRRKTTKPLDFSSGFVVRLLSGEVEMGSSTFKCIEMIPLKQSVVNLKSDN